MEEKIDAVKMVRDIRDRIYQSIEHMKGEELTKYLNTQGKNAMAELKKAAEKRLETK